MITEDAILEFLNRHEAVLTGRHFIFTKGGHGTAYVNIRAVAHCAGWLNEVGSVLGQKFDELDVDIVIGPETLGRTLVPSAANVIATQTGIWCDVATEVDGSKRAEFDTFRFPQFPDLLPGKRVGIVDDLLTSGSSVRAVAELVEAHGGIPAVAGAVVRRTPDVTEEDCGTDELVVLADIPGFVVYTPEQCTAFGPCKERVPVVLKQGHGRKWILRPENAGYPTE